MWARAARQQELTSKRKFIQTKFRLTRMDEAHRVTYILHSIHPTFNTSYFATFNTSYIQCRRCHCHSCGNEPIKTAFTLHDKKWHFRPTRMNEAHRLPAFSTTVSIALLVCTSSAHECAQVSLRPAQAAEIHPDDVSLPRGRW